MSTTVVRRRFAQDDSERGSATIWMITTALTMVLLVGLAVDLGGQVLAKQHAQVVAFEAARAGGQQLQGPAAVLGQGAVVDPVLAVAAATTYIAGTPEVVGTASVVGDRVVVDTVTTYQTRFLSIVGIQQLTVTGHAEARTVRAVEGVVG
ncbi:TadE/TadG family type IV pilus assembly protein [Cellulomonas sp. C5510]|uniref:TadE/TadG family type IV pilus assembly protein n=1 Tax=Cellulomonas sp. C5510 TaxID=2871170 RepID=UPI001C95573B|nr:pilus assembly protein TadG-related protein [Cellulomonas sp. C5510]QZN87031.1 pilus assembly protein [Cellulomonas sp. C5510]